MGNAQLKQDLDANAEFADELEAGSTLMHGQYTIERFLNAGGFGITYEARDSLDRRVVIKECFPGAFCRRSTALVTARSRAHQKELGSIVRLFVQEARSLAKLDHPNIVGVHQVFEENNTAYMALDFVEGRDLLELIEDPNDSLTPAEVENTLRQVLDAIGFIHNEGILHRDISPDNILLDKDRNPVLIDFGAAREQATKQSRVLSALRVVKDGYSPQEFYIAGSEQGPYSDLYALGASFYHLLTNELPPNSQARLAAVASGESDPYQPLDGRIDGYKDGFLAALDQSLAILPKDRIESAPLWIEMMDGSAPIKVASTAAAPETKAKTPEAKPKSSKGLLLATVAVIGLVAAGVATQTDLLSGGETTPVVAENVKVEAPVAPALEPIVETVDTAPVVAEPEVETAAITPEVAAEPAVIIGETDVAPSVVEPGPIEFAALPIPQEPVVEAPEDVATAAVEDAIVEETVEETIAEVAEPVIETPVEVPGPAPAYLADLPVQVAVPEGPNSSELTSVAIPVKPVRPSTPDAAKLVSSADQTPSEDSTEAAPFVVAQSDMSAFDLTVFTQSLDAADLITPDQTTNVWTGARTIPVGLPKPQADAQANVSTTPAEAPVPVSPELQIAGLETTWSVRLPYEGLIGGAEGETRIFAVGDTEVYSMFAFNEAIRNTVKSPRNGEAEVSVLIGTTRNNAERKVLTLPVVQTTELANGLRFDTAFEDGKWVTRVAHIPGSVTVDMKPGDIIFGHLESGEILAERMVLPNILARGRLEGKSVFNFAVKRGDTSWFANFPFSGS